MINACVSHELRNPLNSIIAQNIEKYMLYKKLQEILDIIKNGEILQDCIKEMQAVID